MMPVEQIRSDAARRSRRTAAITACFILLMLVPALAAWAQAIKGAKPEYVPGELLVGYKPGVAAAEVQSLHTRIGATLARRFTFISTDYVRLPKGMTVEQAIAMYTKDGGVLYAEPNYKVKALDSPDLLPNDPLYPQQWAWPKIKAPRAWGYTTGSDTVVVADIDTGVDYTHRDLAANMWRNPGEIPDDGVDNDGNGYVDDVYGIDAANDDSDPKDDHGHGTHTSGTIGAVGNNGTDVAGANWTVRIMALKFLNSDGGGSTEGAITCLEYVTKMRKQFGINIVATSNSWGGGGESQALKRAFNAAGRAGVIHCCAAGNSGSDNDVSPQYPPSYDLDSIIAVAASGPHDGKAAFSCYGATSVDIAAPGVGILSTFPRNKTKSWDGTSMATPHVTGACALIAATRPGIPVDIIKAIVLRNADPLPQWAGLCVSGGRLNLYRCVTPCPQVVANTPERGTTGVPRDTTIKMLFSQRMSKRAVEGKFTLTSGAGGTASAVAGTWKWGNAYTAVFTPSAPLDWKTTYTAKLLAAAKSVAGKRLDGNFNGRADGSPDDDFQWQFTTEAPAVPQCTLVSPAEGAHIGPGAYTCQATATPTAPATVTSVRFDYVGPGPTLPSSPDLAIPDVGDPVTDVINCTQSGSLADIQVYVNITHTWIGDLTVKLTSPSGTSVLLHNRTGGSTHDLVGWFPTVLTPAEPLSRFADEPINGNWTIEVQDHAALDVGTLNEWRLKLKVWAPIGVDSDGPSSGYWEVPWDLSALTAGTYQVRAQAIDSYGSTGSDVSEGVVVTP